MKDRIFFSSDKFALECNYVLLKELFSNFPQLLDSKTSGIYIQYNFTSGNRSGRAFSYYPLFPRRPLWQYFTLSLMLSGQKKHLTALH